MHAGLESSSSLMVRAFWCADSSINQIRLQTLDYFLKGSFRNLNPFQNFHGLSENLAHFFLDPWESPRGTSPKSSLGVELQLTKDLYSWQLQIWRIIIPVLFNSLALIFRLLQLLATFNTYSSYMSLLPASKEKARLGNKTGCFISI